MGRVAQGWKLRQQTVDSPYYVRFRHAGRRIELSTGTKDPGEAATRAAQIYADRVTGRRVSRAVEGRLDAVVEAYLLDLAKTVSPAWLEIVSTYFGAHLLPFFRAFDAFTSVAYGEYIRYRLQHVTRASLRHELSALRQFATWCTERGTPLPPVPSLPKHGHAGTRATKRKRRATILTRDEVARILAAMPVRSLREPHHLVRALFVVLWETGLRAPTVLGLEAPLHYRKGQGHLFITAEIDKEGYERDVPLSAAARRALDASVPAGGRIFTAPVASLRHYLAAALRRLGWGDRPISKYDLKHTRLTLGANTPGVPLTGLAHMVGHKHVTTTAKYIQPGAAAAKDALAAMNGGSFGGSSGLSSRMKRKNLGAKEGT